MKTRDKTGRQPLARPATLPRPTDSMAALDSERQRTEAALYSSEKKFAKAFHFSPSPMSISTLRDGRYIDANESFIETTGYHREELVGHTSSELSLWVNPEERIRFIQILQRQGFARNLEFKFRMKSGDIRMGLVSADVIDINGEPCLIANVQDITGRQQMEEALRESQETLHIMFDSVTDGLLVTDLEGVILDCNESIVEMYGYRAKDEIIGQVTSDFISPHDYERAMGNLDKTLEEGSVRNIEYTIVRPDGTGFPAEVSTSMLKDISGNPTGFIAVIRDITERKRVEEELRRSEQDLAIRSQIADIFLALPDEEMYGEVLEVILERLESKYGIFGYVDERGDLVCPSLTRDIWDQCRIVDKDIIFPREKWGGIWGQALIEKRTLFSNQPLPVPEGHIPINRVLVVPITYAAEPTGLLEVANKPTDYTEKDIQVLETIANHIAPILNARLHKEREEKARQQAEELFRTLCDSSPIGTYITLDGKFRYVNPPMQEILGYRESELLGTDSVSYILPADQDVARANAIAMLKGRRNYPYQYRIINKAGEIRYVMEKATSITYQGKPAVLGNFMDTTERKQIEKEMAEYKALDKFKSDLLSTVSHELRTPLSIIKGYSTLLVDYEPRLSPEEKREYLRSTDSATDRLSELVDRLLDMSRLDAGLLKLELAEISLLKLVRQTVAEAQLRAPHHKIIADVPRRLPRLTADARCIRQVLDNLIDNACKYSDEGTPVTVSARRAGEKLQVSVTDQGIGIPAHELQRVFDRMYRIEQRLSAKAGGIGLGLAICKGLVEAHGGRIWMESEEGKGTTCFFTLPLRKGGNNHGEKGMRQGQFPL